MTNDVKVRLLKIAVKLQVPEDYDLDEDQIEWLEHVIARGANRGTSLEDAECAEWQQRAFRDRQQGVNTVLEAMRDLAGKKFVEGKDKDALILRDLAKTLGDDLSAKLEKEREEHRELFITSYHRRVDEERSKAKSKKAEKSVTEG